MNKANALEEKIFFLCDTCVILPMLSCTRKQEKHPNQ